MKLYCCYTPAHEVLFAQYFRPTLPPGFSLHATELEITGAGDFFSPEFLRCIAQKMDLILASFRENDGRVIAWSDIDIQFFDVSPARLLEELGSSDIAFQREGPRVAHVNAGFFVCRCSERVHRFFERVKEGVLGNAAANEQFIINNLLAEGDSGVDWVYLPMRYYARTHGWPPPRDLALYHANFTPGRNGVGQKAQQFRELAFLRRYGWPALLLTSLKYAPRRIWRVLSEAFLPAGRS